MRHFAEAFHVRLGEAESLGTSGTSHLVGDNQHPPWHELWGLREAWTAERCLQLS